MSNGDVVLDNWEEIDEAALQSTLQNLKTKKTTTPTPVASELRDQISSSIDSSASQQFAQQQPAMKLLQRSAQDSPVVIASRSSAVANNPNYTQSPLDDMSAAFQPVMMVLHKTEDEYQSANYTQPIVNQTVKILRRPTQSSEPRNNGIRPKQPIKTLKQREQEYAEARLRILGSAKNPEDEELRAASADAAASAEATTPPNISIPATPTSVAISTVATIAPGFHTNVAPSTAMKLNSPKIQGGPNIYNNHFQYQQQPQHTLQQQQQQQQQQLQLHLTQQQQLQPSLSYPQQGLFHPNFQQQQPQQQQQTFYYNQQPQSPAYNSNNNNRTFSSMPLLGHGPMGAIGQPAQYQQVPTPPQSVTAQASLQQQMKMQQQQQQYHHKSSQLKQQHQKQQQLQTWSPIVGGSVSSASLRQQQIQQQQQSNESIVRLPRGPDGTVGFQTRR